MDPDIGFAYRLWMKQMADHGTAIIKDRASLPTPAKVTTRPDCDYKVDKPVERVRSQSDRFEWCSILDGAPFFCANCRLGLRFHSTLSCEHNVALKTLLWFHNLDWYEKSQCKCISDVQLGFTGVLQLREAARELREGLNLSRDLYKTPTSARCHISWNRGR